MEQTSLSKAEKRQYILAVMLIQIALDTHDLIPASKKCITTDHEQMNMQLSVLAGDFYSGLYYLILANLDDIKMVQILATAIKEINECKMKLYYKEVSSLSEYLSLKEKIGSLLIIRFSDYFKKSQALNQIVSRLLLVN